MWAPDLGRCVGESEAFEMGSKVHVRRCHVCGEVNEAKGELVHDCGHCGKHLAPFYYFNEKRAMNLISQEEADKEYKSSALPLKDYPLLWGLSVYWDP